MYRLFYLGKVSVDFEHHFQSYHYSLLHMLFDFINQNATE